MVSNDDAMSSGSESSSSPTRQMTVVDVYDLASVIGKDFEQIIDHYGSDSVVRLMPKVISTLELLETFATRNERENEEILALKAKIEHLEAEKEEKKEGRHKFEMEMEQIEENYRVEIRQLWEMVQKLQDENKRLLNNLEQKVESPSQALKEEDFKVMLTLQGTVDKHRDNLKTLQKECDGKSEEVETLQRQLEKLQRSNKELTRKNKVVQNQGRALVEEKVDLMSLLQERDQLIVQLQLQLGESEKAKKDLEETKVEPPVDGDHLPRFTLAELREVLQEKNQLKAKVMELEEELAQLRPAPTPSPNTSEICEKTDDEELVVYGPINREPEEKLFPWKYHRKDSGVRKFLQNMFRKSENRRHAEISNSGKNKSAYAVGEKSNLQIPVTTPPREFLGLASASFSKTASAQEVVLNRAGIAPPDSSVRLYAAPTPTKTAVAAAYSTSLPIKPVHSAPAPNNRVNNAIANEHDESFIVRYVQHSSSSSNNNNNNSATIEGEADQVINDEIEEPIEFSLTDDDNTTDSSAITFYNNHNSLRRRSSLSSK